MTMKKSILQLFLIGLAFCLPFGVLGQITTVKGTVIDGANGELMPFVNVQFKGTTLGTTTDLQGKFTLSAQTSSDSITISFLGYQTQIIAINNGKYNAVNITLQPESVQLFEFIVESDAKVEDKDPPAIDLMKKVIKHKPENNREKLAAYQYEAYHKVQFNATNISEKMQNRWVMKPFKFVFEDMDSTGLPMFITESISEIYYRKNPRATKEVIKATQVAGVENESVSQFLGDMYQNVNIYDNFLVIFGKNFASPVADNALGIYNYFIMDTVLIDNDSSIRMQFIPKRKRALTFEGTIWIALEDYAIKQLDLTISDDANINFIEGFSVRQRYDNVGQSNDWMLTKDQLEVVFEVAEKSPGLRGIKTSSYDDFTINQPLSDDFYNAADDVLVLDSAAYQSDEYWEDNRHEKLSNTETGIYHLVDTIKDLPAFRTYLDLAQMFFTGYKVLGPVELGPYYSMYSFNQIEGNRFRIGGRTSNEFSTRLMLGGHIAYGLKDETFKYGANFQYFLKKNRPRHFIAGSYKKDYEQLGQSANAWTEDNIITSIFRRNPLNKLSGVEEYSIRYNYEWFQGLSHDISLTHRGIWPLGTLEFNHETMGGGTEPVGRINTTEIKFSTRFAFREKYVNGEFERVSLGTKFPVVSSHYTVAMSDFLNGDYTYHKVILTVEDRIRMNRLGFSDVYVEAGKIFSHLPYPLLALHRGNETLSYDPYAFNLMNYYEFASDQFVSLMWTHHFEGLFFNRIPLFAKLKWREVASAKMVYGSLSDTHQKHLIYPDNLYELKIPYAEAGVGIENIFKFIRVDALWRLTYLDHANIANFGIRGSVQFFF